MQLLLQLLTINAIASIILFPTLQLWKVSVSHQRLTEKLSPYKFKIKNDVRVVDSSHSLISN